MLPIQQGFLNIQTVFDENTERTVDALQQVYSNHQRLVKMLGEISANAINETSVAGKKVLLKPNWVKQSYKQFDDLCLRTNDSYLLAVLEVVIAKKPASIVIGDAPIQGCNWDRMISQQLLDNIAAIAEKYQIPVMVKDFRRVTFDTTANKTDVERNPMSEYIIFDVGKASYLEPITKAEKNQFRVSQYDPDKFVQTHKPGMHKYCITKELFNADIVISIPKIKTHQKAGITCALKNIVGLNGDKDFLPHHRIGGTEMGGDSYPGKNILRYWSELALDNANRKKGKPAYWFWIRLSTVLWKISLPKNKHQLSAAWYGNDTTWRMVMDLNTIVVFGKEDGTLADTPQRFLYSFCDGIVGGEGDGPLYPDPLNLGVVCFSNDSPTTDICMATLMGLNIEKIPLLMAAKSFMPGRKVELQLNGQKTTQEELKKYACNAKPSPGWMQYEKV
jgi:uncharacterized protein (DUF362 family)